MVSTFKLVNIIQCLNLGGMEQATRLWMAGLQSRGVAIQTYSVTPAGAGRKLLNDMGIPVKDHPYQGKYGWRTHAELRRSLKSADADVVFINGPTLTGCIAARQIRCKNQHLAVHFHHYSGRFDYLKWKLFYKIFENDYRSLIYPTQFILKEAQRAAPYLSHKMTVVPYPVACVCLPTTQEKTTAKLDLGFPIDSLLVGNAGWLITRKRFDVFLLVAAQLIKHVPNCYFVIAGDGPLKRSLVRQAQMLGLTDRIKFIGWQTSLDGFYRALDLLVFNTDADAFPRTPLEAMSFAVPVVASAVYGGTDELILDGETGLLISQHNIERLVKNAVSVLTDDKLRTRIISTAQDKLKRKHTLDTISDKLINLFKQGLSH